jgi:superfamily II DNA or RNA helicase
MQIVRRDPDKAYLDTWLWVPRGLINVTATQSALSFVFEDYSGNKEILCLWKEHKHHLLVPRYFWNPSSIPCEVVDCRPRTYPHIEFKSRILLDHRVTDIDKRPVLMPTGDDVQRRSLAALQTAMGGVLQLACGKGKTVVALQHIACSAVPAIIAVDNTNLLWQWDREINTFLDVPGGIGYLMQGHNTWKRGIVLATYHTLANRADEMPEEVRRWFGNIYFDEGHHVSAPVFSKTVDLIYGNRYALTATPERADGWHVICDFHVGPVLHKDLRQSMKARILFKWTGLELELTNPTVYAAVIDVNKEVHASKVSTYFGQWRERMWLMMQDCIDAIAVSRKVLLLSNSVNEVINLMTMWTRGPHAALYTDVPVPIPHEVGETLTPLALDDQEARTLKKRIVTLWGWANGAPAQQQKFERAQYEARDLMLKWQMYLVYKKILAELRRRQKQFLKDLLAEPSTAGVMTYGVPPKIRQGFLDERPVVFAITKYGKEGLDCPELDTVLVSSLFSQRNSLQQLMGRPTRPKAGKKPIVGFYVDNVGHCIGMSQKLQKHLREWPHEESGPFDYELIGYPKVKACVKTLKEAFGQ